MGVFKGTQILRAFRLVLLSRQRTPVPSNAQALGSGVTSTLVPVAVKFIIVVDSDHDAEMAKVLSTRVLSAGGAVLNQKHYRNANEAEMDLACLASSLAHFA